jgi:hypothetical protein
VVGHCILVWSYYLVRATENMNYYLPR